MHQFIVALLSLAILLAVPQTAKADRKLEVWTLIHDGKNDEVGGALAATDLAEQRAAFSAFETSDPVVGAFSKALLAEKPNDPNAMTARGWYLLAAGWTIRGSGYASSVFPEAAEQMQILHDEASALANAALATDPLLIPASDLRMVASMTTGQTEIVSDEIQRVMQIAPNRHSLMTAALALSPKWGGSEDYGFQMCELWAETITDVEDYTVEICKLDVVFSAGYEGKTLEDAQEQIETLSHPVFDGPRLRMAGNGMLPADEALAIFQELSGSDAYTLRDAARWDQLEGNGGYEGPPGLPGPRTRDALPELLARLRAAADFDPGDIANFWEYADALIWQRIADGGPFPTEEMEARFAALVALAPYDPESYIRISYLRSLFIDVATVTLEEIGQLRTGFENAAFFSNNSPEYIGQLFGFNKMYWDELDKRNIDELDASGEPAFDRDEFNAEIVCPTIRSILLLEMLCEASTDPYLCPQFPQMVGGDPRPKMIERAKARNACSAEFEADMDGLLYSRVPLILPD